MFQFHKRSEDDVTLCPSMQREQTTSREHRTYLYDRPAKLGSRQGHICEQEKQFPAAILFIVTRVGLGGNKLGGIF
jgi:hypothetical protein